ncbi:MAG TPA: hypothetical protein ENI41_08285 [Deltaproteobacteria bacterium]|nr:hypothetical protein [Deltaproteobacteria bacterium]
MKTIESEKDIEKRRKRKPLPLVIEIMPGQSGIGLIDIFQPGSYEQKSLRDLCNETLKKRDWSVEERELLENINKQLDGGILLSKGRTIDSKALEYANVEETEAGEKYFYVPIRAIKPQEGGT